MNDELVTVVTHLGPVPKSLPRGGVCETFGPLASYVTCVTNRLKGAKNGQKRG